MSFSIVRFALDNNVFKWDSEIESGCCPPRYKDLQRKYMANKSNSFFDLSIKLEVSNSKFFLGRLQKVNATVTKQVRMVSHCTVASLARIKFVSNTLFLSHRQYINNMRW